MGIRGLMLRSEFEVDAVSSRCGSPSKVASIDLDSRSKGSSALSSLIVHCPEYLHSDSKDAQKCVGLYEDAGPDWLSKYPHLGIRALND